jgi:hypothetical protein
LVLEVELGAMVQQLQLIKDIRDFVVDYTIKPNNLLINLTVERADE